MYTLKRKVFGPLLVALCLATVCHATETLDYSSYVYTTKNLIFFSYEGDTALEIYEADGSIVYYDYLQPVLVNEGNPLNKGGYAKLTSPEEISADSVYFVKGSAPFSVLEGDPGVDGVCGYYFVDGDGFGVGREFYGFVSREFSQGPDNRDRLIVTAQHSGGNVVVEEIDEDGEVIDTLADFR